MSFVPDSGARHDWATGVADRSTSEPLDAALRRIRLAGAIFLRAEYREAWSYQSLDGAQTAQILRPGTDRVILFHVVADGTCWVEVDGLERHWARTGDVIVLPYGDQHRMGGIDKAVAVPLTSIMDPPPWQHMPVIRHGSEGRQTDIVCGFLHSEDLLFDPVLRVFPPVFVAHPVGPAAAWVQATIAYALDQADASPLGPDAMSSRLPELLLIEVLRLHLATAPAVDSGLLGGLQDPVLNPALAAIHTEPARHWSVTDLAHAAAVSRSLLDARFREVLGCSPIRYLTEWRMHIAEDLLASTDLGVAAVARRVGYDADEAFSRAFKRAHGMSPTTWRLARHR